MTAPWPEVLVPYAYLARAALAGLFGGGLCAVAGVYIVTMRLSFLGVCLSHGAFAGALFGLLAGIHPVPGAIAFSLLTAAGVGPLADRGEVGPDTAIGILFSLMMGLAFLFLGLLPAHREEALGLLWGNILTVSGAEVAMLAGTTLGMLAVIILFFKEIQSVACHRDVAHATGVPDTVVFYGILCLLGVVMSVTLPSIGGLLVFSLVINPAAAALQWCRRFRTALLVAAILGVGCCWVGLAISWWFSLPAGATIVLVSTVVFAVSLVLSPRRRNTRWTVPAT
ncbi:MAG: metal ABC transporter permease [Candidatus Hydrogenedentes bacterium]|nr:metal ABC transporter permease [Candidatus Hydrogenedentota bacterium]